VREVEQTLSPLRMVGEVMRDHLSEREVVSIIFSLITGIPLSDVRSIKR